MGMASVLCEGQEPTGLLGLQGADWKSFISRRQLVMELSTAPSLDCAKSGSMDVHMKLDF